MLELVTVLNNNVSAPFEAGTFSWRISFSCYGSMSYNDFHLIPKESLIFVKNDWL